MTERGGRNFAVRMPRSWVQRPSSTGSVQSCGNIHAIVSSSHSTSSEEEEEEEEKCVSRNRSNRCKTNQSVNCTLPKVLEARSDDTGTRQGVYISVPV